MLPNNVQNCLRFMNADHGPNAPCKAAGLVLVELASSKCRKRQLTCTWVSFRLIQAVYCSFTKVWNDHALSEDNDKSLQKEIQSGCSM